MKVKMILFGFFPSDVRVRKEALTLVKGGHRLTVVSCNEESSIDSFHSIKIFRVGKVSNWKGKMSIRQLLKFWILSFHHLISTRNFDILHCHDFTGLLPGVCYKLFFPSMKIVYDSHEIYPDQVIEKIGKLVGIPVLIMEKFCMKFVNNVIGISKPQEELMKERYGIHEFLYLPNYPTKNEFFWEEMPPNKKTTIIYAGGILPDRGYEQLVDAVAILSKNRDDFIVKLVGDGPLRQKIAKEVELKGLTPFIEIIGFVHYSKVRDILNSADIGIGLYHPTPVTNYGLSNKIFEYIICELPLIFPYRRANAYYLKKVGGIHVNPHSSEDIAEKLEYLITHPEIRRNMKKASRNLASRCVWEAIEDQLLNLYSEI